MAWLAWVWFAATFVPLIWRKRFPVAVIAITGVSTWLYYVTGHWGPLIAAPAIAVLSLRRTRVLEQRSRQVEEERLRIAREVHDVVAHSLAMINVQAGVAAHVADRRPEEAVKALKAIKPPAVTRWTISGRRSACSGPARAPRRCPAWTGWTSW